MACTMASIPVQAVNAAGNPNVISGSNNVREGLSSGCHTHNFMHRSECVTIAVLSVSAPVPAVVGMQISFGKM